MLLKFGSRYILRGMQKRRPLTQPPPFLTISALVITPLCFTLFHNRPVRIITMKTVLSLIFFIFVTLGYAHDKPFSPQEAWRELIYTLNTDYAYLDRLGSEFDVLNKTFTKRALATKTQQEFIDVAQLFLRNFQDPHLNIGPYDNQDYSVYPTGSDIYAEYKENKLIIVDIKGGSEAYQKGLLPTMEIVKVDGLSIVETIKELTGRQLNELSASQKQYALNIALGGKRYKPRALVIKNSDGDQTVELRSVISFDNVVCYSCNIFFLLI
jgi:carboxyl-terminal processing protease